MYKVGEDVRIMKKKILFFITTLAHGGAERVLVNLANNLDKSQYDVTVMTIFDGGVNKQYLNSDVNYRCVFSKVFHGIKYITKFLPSRWLHKTFIKDFYDIEVAYLEGPPAKIISGSRNKKTKKVAWIHIELNSEQEFTEGFKNRKDAVESYKQFDRIVCVSNTVKEQFQKISGIKENVIVKYNTNETEKIIKLSSEQCSDIKYHDEIPTLCSVAKIEHTKGYDRLINVHKKLWDEGLKHRIYVIGIGKDKEKLEQRIKEMGVEDSFQFIGFRDNPYKYISKCDLYVCSSRREGFSTAVTEALVIGTPVVSTKCSGATELLGENNEFGIVVENSEEGIYYGIKEMLKDKTKLEAYKEKAKERGTFFSKEKTVLEVEKMFQEL